MSHLSVPLPSRNIGNDIFDVIITQHDVPVNSSDIITECGYTEATVDRYFHDLVDDLLQQLPDLAAISAGYRIVDIDAAATTNENMYVAGGTFFSVQKIVMSQIRHAAKAAIFACTIGSGLEEHARSCFIAGDPVRGHFADTIASHVAEKVAGVLHDHIEAVMQQEEMKVTNRYSPGYCGWPVYEQQKLFSLLPHNFCSITLSESSLMSPVKSVSGIVGIGKNVVRAPYLCGRCGKNDCSYRQFTEARNIRAVVI